jgi:hypothetical protein
VDGHFRNVGDACSLGSGQIQGKLSSPVQNEQHRREDGNPKRGCRSPELPVFRPTITSQRTHPLGQQMPHASPPLHLLGGHLKPQTGKYRRTRLFVMTLGYMPQVGPPTNLPRSSSRIWAEFHKKASLALAIWNTRLSPTVLAFSSAKVLVAGWALCRS